MQAYSKINLVLNVKSERPDGYHELDTLFYPLRHPADEVSLSFEGEGLAIRCTHPDVPLEPSKNLCGKAVLTYCAAAGIPVPDCVIAIEKNIPCAGGMAGGSTDAAAVLRLMQEKYGLLTESVLAETAKTLGADVPFFLDPVPSRAAGIGEKLIRYPEIKTVLPLVIAAPDFPISAKWAYQHWDESCALRPDAAEKCVEALRNQDLQGVAEHIGNSLAPAAFAKFPLLAMLKKSFLKQGALCAELSGSGPAVFALFESREQAVQAGNLLKEKFMPVRFFV